MNIHLLVIEYLHIFHLMPQKTNLIAIEVKTV